MAFVQVPKDLTRVRSKVALNLTKRQILCFGGGALIGIPAYLATRGALGNETAALLMILLMLPFFMFGIYEKDGQPLEKALGHMAGVLIFRPPDRPYRTENGYAALERLKDHGKGERQLGCKDKKAKAAGGNAPGRV